MMSVGFIGFGRMGGALAKGAVASKVLKKSQIWAYSPSVGTRAAIKRTGFHAALNIHELVSACSLIFLCVKPQKMGDVLTDVSAALMSKKNRKKCFVSIAAGVTIRRIKDQLGSSVPVLRIMPNTPALVGAGMSVVSIGAGVSGAQKKWTVGILKGVGEVAIVPESFMDAVTALSGSGPAYVFYLAEGLVKAAVEAGLDPKMARQLVQQTIFGAGLLLKKRTESAEELRRQVTSPGGTTAAAIGELEANKFLKIIQAAVAKATVRSAELAKF